MAQPGNRGTLRGKAARPLASTLETEESTYVGRHHNLPIRAGGR